jgi:hypothetical protein
MIRDERRPLACRKFMLLALDHSQLAERVSFLNHVDEAVH